MSLGGRYENLTILILFFLSYFAIASPTAFYMHNLACTSVASF